MKDIYQLICHFSYQYFQPLQLCLNVYTYILYIREPLPHSFLSRVIDRLTNGILVSLNNKSY